MERLRIHKRPGRQKRLVAGVLDIIKPLTGPWFTRDVGETIGADILFHDMAVLYSGRIMESFIVFTSLDGSIFVTLMATRPESRGKGFGTKLFGFFENYVRRLGFDSIKVQTVPADVNPNYRGTIAFYEKMGFSFQKRYNELWQSGAVEYVKNLS